MFQHQWNGGDGERVRGQDVEGEGVPHVLDRCGEQGVGHGAADVVHHDVEPAERLHRLPGQGRGGLGLGQVGDDDVGAPAGCLHLVGDGLQL